MRYMNNERHLHMNNHLPSHHDDWHCLSLDRQRPIKGILFHQIKELATKACLSPRPDRLGDILSSDLRKGQSIS